MRQVGRPKRSTPWPKCKIMECVNTIEDGAKGFCRSHYFMFHSGLLNEDGSQARPRLRVASYGPGAQCSVKDCARRPRGNGMCSMHWLRAKKGYELEAPVQPRLMNTPLGVTCSVPECDVRPSSRGLCPGHASQRDRGMIDAQGNKLRDRLPSGRPRSKERWISSGRDGYILVWAPEGHPHARCDGTIFEHRLVMEKKLGRYLEDWELVHHKDGNRQHNDEGNLELLDGRARKGPGHPPGHEFDPRAAVQVLLQQEDVSDETKQALLNYQAFLAIQALGKAR
jgi:hypothetical protein